MDNNNESSLLLIAFDNVLAEPAIEELGAYCKIHEINEMDKLEKISVNFKAIIYLMDLTSADHLFNIHYIRNKFLNRQFIIISASVSIPLLHEALHIGVNDLFIYPLSNQDKYTLSASLQAHLNHEYICDEEVSNDNGQCAQINKAHPIISLLDIIERDYAKGPSLQDLAADVHLSPSRVCHLFKDLFGITYSHYLLFRKIEEGERLLTENEYSITSISYQIGFANPSHFCRTFKEHFNITPSAYVNGEKEIVHSLSYLRYQRLRYELFSKVDREAETQFSLAEVHYVQ